MKIFLLILVLVVSATMSPFSARATVIANPASITVARGIQTTKTISFNISGMVGCLRASSNTGEFLAGQYLLGTVKSLLSVQLIGGSGTASETFVIPIGIIKKAEQLGVNRLQYRRQFSFVCQIGAPVETGSVEITLTSEATADFMVTRLQLYFENRRAEITVTRNQPGLKAYAEIRYVGSGLLKGYWEVDGRIFSHVNRHLIYGRSAIIESPEVPAFPTFVTGTHIVRFVITAPPSTLPTPEAIYFVRAEQFKRIFPINLISPEDRASIQYTPPTFQWENREETAVYLIEFLEEGLEKPIFSAYSKKTSYTLPAPVLKGIFTPSRDYIWRVKGFDADNNIVGESGAFKFKFREESPPGG